MVEQPYNPPAPPKIEADAGKWGLFLLLLIIIIIIIVIIIISGGGGSRRYISIEAGAEAGYGEGGGGLGR